MTIVVGVEEFLEPLEELKVVLEFSFDKLVNRNDFLDSQILPCSLDQLPVGEPIKFETTVPFDLLQLDAFGEQKVGEQTIASASVQLLDLGEVGLETIVDPHKHLVPREVVG